MINSEGSLRKALRRMKEFISMRARWARKWTEEQMEEKPDGFPLPGPTGPAHLDEHRRHRYRK